jgi:hypothetical protein
MVPQVGTTQPLYAHPAIVHVGKVFQVLEHKRRGNQGWKRFISHAHIKTSCTEIVLLFPVGKLIKTSSQLVSPSRLLEDKAFAYA